MRTLDEGVLVDCLEQEDLGLQMLVACDANKHISTPSRGKGRNETYIAIATETAKCNTIALLC